MTWVSGYDWIGRCLRWPQVTSYYHTVCVCGWVGGWGSEVIGGFFYIKYFIELKCILQIVAWMIHAGYREYVLSWTWPASELKQRRANDLLWILRAKRAWWSALMLLLLLMWVILLQWMDGEAWIAASSGLFSQCPGASKTVCDLAAVVNTEQSE
jgi:hypothetical protein